MVRKIKRRIRRPSSRQGNQWLVGFDSSNQAAVYIHKHGDSDDHSNCGPVVSCCKRAADVYKTIAPELHRTVERYDSQTGEHIATWLDSGVSAMYFAVCDPDVEGAIYQFGLPAERARRLLSGQDSRAIYFRPEYHVRAVTE